MSLPLRGKRNAGGGTDRTREARRGRRRRRGRHDDTGRRNDGRDVGPDLDERGRGRRGERRAPRRNKEAGGAADGGRRSSHDGRHRRHEGQGIVAVDGSKPTNPGRRKRRGRRGGSDNRSSGGGSVQALGGAQRRQTTGEAGVRRTRTNKRVINRKDGSQRHYGRTRGRRKRAKRRKRLQRRTRAERALWVGCHGVDGSKTWRGKKEERDTFGESVGSPRVVTLDNTPHNKNGTTRKAVTPSPTRRTNHATSASSPNNTKRRANPRITLQNQGRRPETGLTLLGRAETRPMNQNTQKSRKGRRPP